jgi:hypothetical protein
MLPWGHLAVGYIVYSLAVRYWTGRGPQAVAVAAVGFGTQLPDLIDKPLVTWVSVLPAGRSLGHSLLFAVACGAGLRAVRRDVDRRVVGALLVGQVTHVVADAAPAALAGRWAELGFLLWPLTRAFRYGAGDRVLVEYLIVEVTTPPHYQLVLLGVALALWAVDGCPGVQQARRWLRDRYRGRSSTR